MVDPRALLLVLAISLPAQAQDLPTPRYVRVIVGYHLCEPGQNTACVVVGEGFIGIRTPEPPGEKALRLFKANKYTAAIDLMDRYWDSLTEAEIERVEEWLRRRNPHLCATDDCSTANPECNCDILRLIHKGR